jgi:hypothetical protein
VSRFFYAGNLHELTEPEHVRPFLADPALHWKKGYSACELATSWIGADDFPAPVRRALDQSPPYRGATLIEGFFERQTDLRTPGRPSQTDLMVLGWLPTGLAVIGVEGKAEESFGQLVADWNTSPGRATRLAHLCKTFGVAVHDASALRYQLFHRTAAALFEAQRYRAKEALVLVHSFSKRHAWLDDFLRFAAVIGIGGAGKDQVSEAKLVGDIELRLGWVSDEPSRS